MFLITNFLVFGRMQAPKLKKYELQIFDIVELYDSSHRNLIAVMGKNAQDEDVEILVHQTPFTLSLAISESFGDYLGLVEKLERRQIVTRRGVRIVSKENRCMADSNVSGVQKNERAMCLMKW
jgi:hypothetical protein